MPLEAGRWNQPVGHPERLRRDRGVEYGALLNAHHPTSGPGTVEQVYDTFHHNLTSNPCPA